jgi:hypothetical protein
MATKNKVKGLMAWALPGVAVVPVLYATPPVQYCCRPVWETITGGGGSDNADGPCAPPSATACEDAPVGAETGWEESSFPRLAQCYTYTSASFLKRDCSLGPPSGGPWTLIPGRTPDGYCCYVIDSNPVSANRTFFIQPCYGRECPRP